MVSDKLMFYLELIVLVRLLFCVFLVYELYSVALMWVDASS